MIYKLSWKLLHDYRYVKIISISKTKKKVCFMPINNIKKNILLFSLRWGKVIVSQQFFLVKKYVRESKWFSFNPSVAGFDKLCAQYICYYSLLTVPYIYTICITHCIVISDRIKSLYAPVTFSMTDCTENIELGMSLLNI